MTLGQTSFFQFFHGIGNETEFYNVSYLQVFCLNFQEHSEAEVEEDDADDELGYAETFAEYMPAKGRFRKVFV